VLVKLWKNIERGEKEFDHFYEATWAAFKVQLHLATTFVDPPASWLEIRTDRDKQEPQLENEGWWKPSNSERNLSDISQSFIHS